MSQKPEIVVEFLKKQLASHKNEGRKEPMFVGVQGPQGSGKSYLSRVLHSSLSPIHPTLVLSLDDFYLAHSSQSELSNSNPSNPLLTGRGPPGTHDLPLLLSVFHSLKTRQPTTLPQYDKSLFFGRGDRIPGIEISSSAIEKAEIVIFEGWMVGFYPVTHEVLVQRKGEWSSKFPDEVLKDSNERLRGYEELWKKLDCFVQLKPEQQDFIWQWRLQQEHEMKAGNGGKGMTDQEVENFIARYMPSYELFGEGVGEGNLKTGQGVTWKGKGLRITIGRERQVQLIEDF